MPNSDFSGVFMKVKSILFAILACSMIFSGCASMDRSEINWETTNYKPIGSGGYLPEKWAKNYSGSHTETVVGYLCCCTLILIPVGAPLAFNGLYRAHRYETEGKKEEYYKAYQKQLAKRDAEIEAYNKQLEAEKEAYKKQLESQNQ